MNDTDTQAGRGGEAAKQQSVKSEPKCPLCDKPLKGERYFHSDCATREQMIADWAAERRGSR